MGMNKLKGSVLILVCSGLIFGMFFWRVYSDPNVTFNDFYSNMSYLNNFMLGLSILFTGIILFIYHKKQVNKEK